MSKPFVYTQFSSGTLSSSLTKSADTLTVTGVLSLEILTHDSIEKFHRLEAVRGLLLYVYLTRSSKSL